MDRIVYDRMAAHDSTHWWYRARRDILSEYLATGGPAAFYVRLTLAATLSPTYGIYSVFEHHEHGLRGALRAEPVLEGAAHLIAHEDRVVTRSSELDVVFLG